MIPVSYTHLDVYKRQYKNMPDSSNRSKYLLPPVLLAPTILPKDRTSSITISK